MLSSLFERGLSPHGFCLLWQPELLWLHALSDIATGLAYYIIPVGLIWLVIKHRDLAFGWMFWLFGAFILLCGTTHFMDVWVLWNPDYGIQGLLKAFTALASIMTAALLLHIMPRLLAVPTPGQLRRVSDQLSDTSARHEKTIEQLRRSQESFELLVESVHDCAMFMLDTTGHITSWNAGAQHIKRYRANEIIGRHFSCFYTAEDQASDKPMQALETAASSGTYQEEGWRVRKDGSLFIADVLINPILDRTGALVGFVKITRDISDRKQAEADLEQTRAALAQSQKMEAVGQLTGGIAHDFNNMLTAVIGSVEMLEARQEVFTPEARQLLQVVRHASDRGAELTARLLAFSRKQALSPAIVDVDRLVAGMSELLRRTLGESIAIQTTQSGGLWQAYVDRNQVESALLNLAVNARDAMPSGGRLTIETGNKVLDAAYARRHEEITAGDYVFIAVSDTGVGMDPHVVARAFEPFYTTKELGHGTGLGLSQVYGFAKQSGGHVEIESHLGVGTTVTMYFPRPNEVTPATAASPATVGKPAPRGNETILVVEDDEDVRGYSVGAIRHLGYSVVATNDAVNAQAILDARPDIDLLFTDVGLPGLNGCELASAVTRSHPHVKVVYTSGYARTAINHLGLLQEGVHFLPKPFRINSLAQMLREALDEAPRQ